MLRNREILFFLIAAAATTAITTISCCTISMAAGGICFAGCALVFAAFLVFTVRRYRKIAELNDYLERLMSGKQAMDIRENTEGELSILKNDLYKMTIALTEQAESLQKDKIELASALSDISHQLKTPLTSLSIMIDLLGNDRLPPEKRHEFIASMRAGLDRMEWLVLALLKLARFDADAVVFNSEHTLLTALVDKALTPMLIPMEIKGQNYMAQGEDAQIICDFEWTVEALGNIIKNAVENTPKGGCIAISYGANPLYAYVIVRDSGPGIDKSDLPHLFKRFYRGKNANRDSVGIGLAMSLAVMRKQGGDIEVASENGSMFTMKFYHAAAQ